MKCMGHFCCHNDFCPFLKKLFACNEVSWSGDSLQLSISG
jgi:hypothetical protein